MKTSQSKTILKYILAILGLKLILLLVLNNSYFFPTEYCHLAITKLNAANSDIQSCAQIHLYGTQGHSLWYQTLLNPLRNLSTEKIRLIALLFNIILGTALIPLLHHYFKGQKFQTTLAILSPAIIFSEYIVGPQAIIIFINIAIFLLITSKSEKDHKYYIGLLISGALMFIEPIFALTFISLTILLVLYAKSKKLIALFIIPAAILSLGYFFHNLLISNQINFQIIFEIIYKLEFLIAISKFTLILILSTLGSIIVVAISKKEKVAAQYLLIFSTITIFYATLHNIFNITETQLPSVYNFKYFYVISILSLIFTFKILKENKTILQFTSLLIIGTTATVSSMISTAKIELDKDITTKLVTSKTLVLIEINNTEFNKTIWQILTINNNPETRIIVHNFKNDPEVVSSTITEASNYNVEYVISNFEITGLTEVADNVYDL